MSEQVERPTTDDREAWKAYWTAQGMPWRTEPEIVKERQQLLEKRRAVQSDVRQSIYPFWDENGRIKLSRADMEWLLATHESGGVRGPIMWDEYKQQDRVGLDVKGADLSHVDLRGLPLSRLRGGLSAQEWARVPARNRYIAGTRFDGSNLANVHLERAELGVASMVDASLHEAHLNRAFLARARLERAKLIEAHLQGADLRGHARLERARLSGARLEGTFLRHAALQGADLRRAVFDKESSLDAIILCDQSNGSARLINVRWDDANLTVIDWAKVNCLGDEQDAHRARYADGKRKSAATRIAMYQAAVQAYRQLATALRDQGINEEADRFAFRAQLLQRQVLWRQGHWLRYLGSLLLSLVAGYGYRPIRSVITYLVVIVAFTMAFLVIGTSTGHSLSWNEALIVSLTAFHGRGFFATAFTPGDPQAALAAIEAVIGLLIEITFIATFTQRFFAR